MDRSPHKWRPGLLRQPPDTRDSMVPTPPVDGGLAVPAALLSRSPWLPRASPACRRNGIRPELATARVRSPTRGGRSTLSRRSRVAPVWTRSMRLITNPSSLQPSNATGGSTRTSVRMLRFLLGDGGRPARWSRRGAAPRSEYLPSRAISAAMPLERSCACTCRVRSSARRRFPFALDLRMRIADMQLAVCSWQRHCRLGDY